MSCKKLKVFKTHFPREEEQFKEANWSLTHLQKQRLTSLTKVRSKILWKYCQKSSIKKIKVKIWKIHSYEIIRINK